MAGDGHVAAVRVDVLPQERHLEHAVGGQPLHLGQDLPQGTGPLRSSDQRHDAERAGVVAAHRDADPGVVANLAAGRQRAGEHLRVFADVHLRARALGLAEQLHDPRNRVGPHHDVHPRGPLLDRAPVLLGQTSGHHDAHPRVPILGGAQVAEVTVQPVVGVLPHRARVEHHDLGLVDAVRLAHTVGEEQAGDPLGVVLVHLTAERPDEEPSVHYLATSTARVSRTTVILICPGYWSSSSTCLAMSRARTWAARSSTFSGRTMTRTSRAACMANGLATPGCEVQISSSRSSRFTYCSMLSRRAPGRLPEMASAACASTASTVRCSTSPWCDSMAWTTSGGSLSRRASSAPINACDPSTSWVRAFPMSCIIAHRFTRGMFASASSEAMAPAMCALSTRCFSTFWPYEVRYWSRPSTRTISG